MPHPFDQLSVSEAEKALKIIADATGGAPLHIKTVQTHEPPKKYMIKYLEAEHAGKPIAPPPRTVYALYFLMNERKAEQLWIDLDSGKVTKKEAFPTNQQAPIDMMEGERVLELVRKHPDVIAAVRACGITEDLDVCVEGDPWVYGADSFDVSPRYVMFLMYMRNPKTKHPDSNIYQFPLPFVPVVDAMAGELARIDWCATGNEGDDKDGFNYNTRGGKSIVENFSPVEYMPELRPTPMREDLKAYNVIQPDGPSFTMNGSQVKWQKWCFRVLFNPREGLVLSDVRYDGRQLFYRLSLSEMTVPYGDPRPPLHRKQAFDLGDYGAGMSANSLGLGCDCLGTIKYFDGTLVHGDGKVETRKNVVCMHEQDDGLNFKHVNWRTGTPRVSRRRVLVLQTILTVANYEYIFAWHFDEAAGIDLEIRATGIVSTQYIDPGKKSKWGTIVGPSVLATTHQHVFSVRIDPAVDGHSNTLEVNDMVVPPRDKNNPHGTGFYNTKRYVEKSSAFDADTSKNRWLRIVNENKINPVTMEPVGYSLHALNSALLFAQPGSVARSRAQFATHHFWVSKYRDGEFFAGGEWTNQSSREIGGVQDAVDRNENVRDEDIVLWHSFAVNHVVRPEEVPIMPQTELKVGLRPHGFFTENPAMDVKPSTQGFNRSVQFKECGGCERL